MKMVACRHPKGWLRNLWTPAISHTEWSMSPVIKWWHSNMPQVQVLLARGHTLNVVLSPGSSWPARNKGRPEERAVTAWAIMEMVPPVQVWPLAASVEGGFQGSRGQLRNEERKRKKETALNFGFMPSFWDVHSFLLFHLASPAGDGLGHINL